MVEDPRKETPNSKRVLSYRKEKKDSQTFPALNIFVLLHFVIYEDTCIKKVKIKKI